jgi:hypothetical protein
MAPRRPAPSPCVRNMPPLVENHLGALVENHLGAFVENAGAADCTSPYYSTGVQNGTLDLLLLRPMGARIDASPKGLIFDLVTNDLILCRNLLRR